MEGIYMSSDRQLIIINGRDKTDEVASYRYGDGKCYVTFLKSQNEYGYTKGKVQIYSAKGVLDPEKYIISVKGRRVTGVTELVDFGEWIRIIRNEKAPQTYLKSDVELRENALASKKCATLFAYFKNIAEQVSLTSATGINILKKQYEKITKIEKDTVLSAYLNPEQSVEQRTPPQVLIYPFGINQSQKKAVENAFASQVSIIQGPPGTGKTQTILNIIANAIYTGKTVAVVSNNNSATSNVAEKLAKKDLDFLSAFLGSLDNKKKFIEGQTSEYPDMAGWEMDAARLDKLKKKVQKLTEDINQQLDMQNRIAEVNQELLVLETERQSFLQLYQKNTDPLILQNFKLSSEKTVALWIELETIAEQNEKISPWKKIFFRIRFGKSVKQLLKEPLDRQIAFLQNAYYGMKKRELEDEKTSLEKKIEKNSLSGKIKELEGESLKLFRADLAGRYHWKGLRTTFDVRDFRGNSAGFLKEFPVILSTTYSIKGTLDINCVYDYLIIDESSQVDLATGVLALSCAKNVVIVGDTKQLPNVLTEADKEDAERFWNGSFSENYHFTTQSLLSSVLATWKNVPETQLKEHYRCNPQIINFCNQKFYDNELKVMTRVQEAHTPLMLYQTNEGNHARKHINQREIDVIRQEILPKLEQMGYKDIGIITPYRDQVAALKKELGDRYDIATVHKFQGREKDAIILTSVDNTITEFVDDPHMLNVAVSRAVKVLAVVTSKNPQNDRTNYGDLARYIAYQNGEIIQSSVYSIFDLLYKDYKKQRENYLRHRKQVSEFDSENLMYSVIGEILKEEEFRELDCAVHVSLKTIIRDYSGFSEEEYRYATNALTHTDFLIFRKIDKSPVMAIEVDGTAFHAEGSKQAERDAKKNHIFEIIGLPLLRLRTDGSGEREKVKEMLSRSLN